VPLARAPLPFKLAGTERFTDDSKCGATHSVLYSDYKKHTTAKFLVIVCGDGYLSYQPAAFCGAASDNATHLKSNVPLVL